MSRRRRVGWWSAGMLLSCAPAGARVQTKTPHIDPVPSTQTRAGPKSVGKAARGPPSDNLGRLVTAPGLCTITGGLDRGDAGYSIALALSYDAAGRAESAVIELEPGCVDEEEDLVAAGLGTQLPCYADVETQTVRWHWNPQGALIAVEHSAALVPDPARGEANLGNRACLVGDEPFLVEQTRWNYDDAGRIVSWTQVYADCDDSETNSETLRYAARTIEVERQGPHPTRTLNIVLGSHGEVVEAGPVHYRYDARGRTTQMRRSDGTIRRWSYGHAWVGSTDGTWTSHVSPNGRVIKLEQDGGRGSPTRVRVDLDASLRPIAVIEGDEHWELEYGGCANSERATQHWVLDALFDLWPFPAPASGSEAAELRDDWEHRTLPLTPF